MESEKQTNYDRLFSSPFVATRLSTTDLHELLFPGGGSFSHVADVFCDETSFVDPLSFPQMIPPGLCPSSHVWSSGNKTTSRVA